MFMGPFVTIVTTNVNTHSLYIFIANNYGIKKILWKRKGYNYLQAQSFQLDVYFIQLNKKDNVLIEIPQIQSKDSVLHYNCIGNQIPY